MCMPPTLLPDRRMVLNGRQQGLLLLPGNLCAAPRGAGSQLGNAWMSIVDLYRAINAIEESRSELSRVSGGMRIGRPRIRHGPADLGVRYL